MSLGINGKPLGWDNYFVERWDKIRQDPDKQDHWERLSGTYKYALTGDSSLYTFNDGGWCGRPYPTVTSKDNVFTSKDINYVRYLSETNQKVKLHGLEDSFNISETSQIIISGINRSSDKTVLVDSTQDLSSVTTEWKVYVVGGRYDGVRLNIVSIDGSSFKLSGYQLGTNGQYRLEAPFVFKLNGVFIDGDYIIHPENDVYYRPEGCKDPSNNDVRARLNGMGVSYSILKSAMTDDERKKTKAIYDNFINHVLSGVSLSDSDEIISAYTGCLFAYHVLKEEYPFRASEIINHSNMAKWKERIDLMISEIGDQDFAQWLEGTYYSPNTVSMLTRSIVYLKWFTGETIFPEYVLKLEKMALGMKVEFMPIFKNPSYNPSDVKSKEYLMTMIQWNDTQWEYDVVSFRRLDMLATVSDALKIIKGVDDPELWWLWDRVNEFGSHDFTRGETAYSPFTNPYAERASLALNGTFNNSDLGLTYHHNESSALQVTTLINTGFDHGPNADNIVLRRNGEWLLTWLVGYSSTDWETHTNNLAPFGEQLAFGNRGQVQYLKGENYFFVKGNRTNSFINEQSRAVFYTQINGEDVIIIKDIIDTKCKEVNGKPDLIVPSDYKHEEIIQMESGNYKHQINWFIPTNDVDVGEDSWSWYGNKGGENYIKGEERVTLKTFVKGYQSGIYNNQDSVGPEYPYVDLGSNKQVQGYSLRIQPDERYGRLEFYHTLYTGNLEIKEIEGGLEVNGLHVRFDPFTIGGEPPLPEPENDPGQVVVVSNEEVLNAVLTIAQWAKQQGG